MSKLKTGPKLTQFSLISKLHISPIEYSIEYLQYRYYNDRNRLIYFLFKERFKINFYNQKSVIWDIIYKFVQPLSGYYGREN